MLAMKCEKVGTTLEELFQPEDLEVILRQSSIRKVINKASDYYHYRVLNLPLPEELPAKNNIATEERLVSLENALQQIAHICKSLLTENNQQILVKETKNDNETNIAEKEGLDFDFETEEITTVNSDNSSNEQINVNDNISLAERLVLNYLEENEGLIAEKYEYPYITTDDDEYGKLVTILEAFKSYDSSISIDHLSLVKGYFLNIY